MTPIDSDPEFKQFCTQLEKLKGTVPLIKPSNAWVNRVLQGFVSIDFSKE